MWYQFRKNVTFFFIWKEHLFNFGKAEARHSWRKKTTSFRNRYCSRIIWLCLKTFLCLPSLCTRVFFIYICYGNHGWGKKKGILLIPLKHDVNTKCPSFEASLLEVPVFTDKNWHTIINIYSPSGSFSEGLFTEIT